MLGRCPEYYWVYASVRISRRLSPSRPATRPLEPSIARSERTRATRPQIRRASFTISPATRRRYPSVISRTRPATQLRAAIPAGLSPSLCPPTTRRTRQVKSVAMNLVSLRLKMKAHQRLYLFDLCHVMSFSYTLATTAALVALLHHPTRVALSAFTSRPAVFRAVFALANGPLGFAVPTLANALVLHPRSRPPRCSSTSRRSRRGPCGGTPPNTRLRFPDSFPRRIVPATWTPPTPSSSSRPCDCTRRGGWYSRRGCSRTGATTVIETRRGPCTTRCITPRSAGKPGTATSLVGNALGYDPARPAALGPLMRYLFAHAAVCAGPCCSRRRSGGASGRTRCSSWRCWRAACGTERGGISG